MRVCQRHQKVSRHSNENASAKSYFFTGRKIHTLEQNNKMWFYQIGYRVFLFFRFDRLELNSKTIDPNFGSSFFFSILIFRCAQIDFIWRVCPLWLVTFFKKWPVGPSTHVHSFVSYVPDKIACDGSDLGKWVFYGTPKYLNLVSRWLLTQFYDLLYCPEQIMLSQKAILFDHRCFGSFFYSNVKQEENPWRSIVVEQSVT